ncbi:hypothetical protein LIER_11400 [Lithospermum erythrorhizon]|uniref:Uncharacterized protein n=1 Tax=Lithospermum erythrorhizon TaxID=34254 RepID=A0AAV3PS91_LITER
MEQRNMKISVGYFQRKLPCRGHVHSCRAMFHHRRAHEYIPQAGHTKVSSLSSLITSCSLPDRLPSVEQVKAWYRNRRRGSIWKQIS